MGRLAFALEFAWGRAWKFGFGFALSWAVDFGRGFAGGLGGLGGCGWLLGDSGEGFEGGGFGLGLDELGAGLVDLGDGRREGLEVGGLDEGEEVGEGDVVDVAEVEGGEGAVEEVSRELGRELDGWLSVVGCVCVHLHGGIMRDEDWRLKGGVGERGDFAHGGGCWGRFIRSSIDRWGGRLR